MSLIEKLKIRSFRGACCPLELNFKPDKHIALMFGESGCGKSCIVDALEFALTGNFGSLAERRGMGRVDKAKYMHSVGSQSSDLLVEASSGKKKWIATLSRTVPQLTGSDGRPAVSVLRRSRLMSFIEAEPAQRYAGLAAFVDVPNCIASEDALITVIKNIAEEQEKKLSAIERDERALEEHWKSEKSSTANWQAWAQDLAKQDVAASEIESTSLDGLLTSIDRLGRTESDMREAVKSQEETLMALEDAKAKLSAVESSGVTASLSVLLERARDFLRRHPDYPNCPVCEKQNTAEVLASSIETRLNALKEVQQAMANHDNAEKNHKAQLRQATDRRSTFLRVAQSVAQEIGKLQGDCVAVTQDILASCQDVACDDDTKAMLAASTLACALANQVHPLKERRNLLQKTVGKAGIVRRLLAEVQQSRKEWSALAQLKSQLDSTLEIVQKCRKEYVNGILLGVAGQADDMYGRIHKGEPLGGLKLWLEKRTSLMLSGKFGSEVDVDLQAYYSESHLDTLGLCVYLALEKRANAACKLLVLDDVLTSVDQPHLERTMELLQDEAASFGQVLITTHYGRFFDDFKRRHSSGSQVQFIRLNQWHFDVGITEVTCLLPADDLRVAMSASGIDKTAVANKAGRLLESILDYMAKRIECPLPYKDNGFTLGELLPAVIGIGTRFKSGVKNDASKDLPESWTELRPLVQKVYEWANVRNLIGAHFNLEGANLSERDVMDFGTMVLDLHAKLVCPQCGEMVRRDTGSLWECRCRRFCVMPLKYKTG